MKKRIDHLADIHIARNPVRHPEFQEVFRRTCARLAQDPPDVIVIAGDIFHDYITASNEATLLAGTFLLGLSAIAPVVVSRGNHDYDKFRPQRIDSVQTVVDLLATDRVRYLNTSGFYIDENIVWVVWHHGDALSPWNVAREARKQGYPTGFYADDIERLFEQYGDFEGMRGDGYTFIDLFHDPLTGSQACNGEVFRDGAYLKISDLQGDYALLGDIHLQQFFTRPGDAQPFAAYPGSLIQQHFGEDELGHGYVRWDLADGSSQAVEIENDAKFYTLRLEPGTDYDLLDLVIPAPVALHPNVRIYWTDNSLHHTQANKVKVRKHIKERYGCSVYFDPHAVDQQLHGASRVGTELDQFDIADTVVQRRLLGEYLSSNGVAEPVIAQVLTLDDQTSERLRVAEGQEGEATGELISNHHGDVRLLSVDIDNFQSIETLKVDFEKNPGVWQISGANESGKTSLAMAIMYLQFGNTLGTVVIKNGEVKSRAEKNGDNRFINNKRDQDSCRVSADYDLGGTLVRATRTTTRAWKRAKAGEPKQISKVSTDYSLHLLTADRQVDEELSVDKRKRTEKLASEAFGTFDDFLRGSFFSADTMSGLLSLDRSVFIDTILRDVKLDIYDRKLKCFREWKSEVGKRTSRLVLDQAVEEAKLSALRESLVVAHAKIEETAAAFKEAQTGLTREQTMRDKLPTQYQPVPAEVVGVSEAQVRQGVHRAVENLHQHGTKEADLARLINTLPAAYDEPRYGYLRTELDASTNWIKGQGLSVRQLGNDADAATNQIVHLEGMRKVLTARADSMKLDATRQLSALDHEFTRRGNEIQLLEQSTVCPTCQQLKTPGAVAAIQADVIRRRQEQTNHDQQGRQQVDQTLQQNLGTLRDEYRANDAALVPCQTGYTNLRAEQARIQATIDQQQVAYAVMGEELAALDRLKREVERRRELELSGSSLPVMRRELELALSESRQRLHIFEAGAAVRLHNEGITEQLSRCDERLRDKKMHLESLRHVLSNLEQVQVPTAERQVTELETHLARYTEQLNREHLWSLYEKSISRDGLPMQLVRRALSSINEQMAELLDGLCFSIYLDEDLEFRMADHRRAGVDQHILQGSGMERTFASLVLRLGLRRLNHRARWNLLIMDEMLGKLDGEATLRYADLLRVAATSIEHVVVIEHHGEGLINADRQLKVHAENGISRYQLTLN